MANYAEYKDIIALMQTSAASKEDVYNKLMVKEESISNMLSDINNKTQSISTGTALYERPLLEIVASVAGTWQIMFNELVLEDMYRTPHLVFWHEERKIYTGILLVILSLVLLLVES